MPAEAQLQASAAGDQPAGKLDEFLDDRFDPPPFGFVTHDAAWLYQRHLADKAQDVVHQCATGHDELVGGKLP